MGKSRYKKRLQKHLSYLTALGSASRALTSLSDYGRVAWLSQALLTPSYKREAVEGHLVPEKPAKTRRIIQEIHKEIIVLM